MLSLTPTLLLLLCCLSGLLARRHHNNRNLRQEQFKEAGFVSTPADRQTELGFDLPQFDDYQDYQDYQDYPPLQRRERDGAFHSHSQARRAGRGRQGRLAGGRPRPGQGGSRRPQTAPAVPEQRQGRQTGGLGLALGVLNNPPREDGSYNFK